MVLWFIGLSGSGKTTLSSKVYQALKPQLPNLVLLDGDQFRNVFQNDVGHTIEGRQKNAERLSKLSQFLALQNIHVIASVLSIFPEWQQWNHDNIPEYNSIYLKASMKILKERDTKGLYAKAANGETSNVVGVDIPFPEPVKPLLTLNHDIPSSSVDNHFDQVMGLSIIKEVLKSPCIS